MCFDTNASLQLIFKTNLIDLSLFCRSLLDCFRWDDDVVFKNTCRNEPVKKKRFINDTIRNDFHKKFLQKYIQ